MEISSKMELHLSRKHELKYEGCYLNLQYQLGEELDIRQYHFTKKPKRPWTVFISWRQGYSKDSPSSNKHVPLRASPDPARAGVSEPNLDWILPRQVATLKKDWNKFTKTNEFHDLVDKTNTMRYHYNIDFTMFRLLKNNEIIDNYETMIKSPRTTRSGKIFGK